MTEAIRASFLTRVWGCELDHQKGEGLGLLQKFIQLKAVEAVSGITWRQCEDNPTNLGSNIQIVVEDNGHCTAYCTSDCVFASKNRS